nr:hypothetical protein [Rhodothermus marinus]
MRHGSWLLIGLALAGCQLVGSESGTVLIESGPAQIVVENRTGVAICFSQTRFPAQRAEQLQSVGFRPAKGFTGRSASQKRPVVNGTHDNATVGRNSPGLAGIVAGRFQRKHVRLAVLVLIRIVRVPPKRLGERKEGRSHERGSVVREPPGATGAIGQDGGLHAVAFRPPEQPGFLRNGSFDLLIVADHNVAEGRDVEGDALVAVGRAEPGQARTGRADLGQRIGRATEQKQSQQDREGRATMHAHDRSFW